MPGHNGGFNPFRDGNGEFTDQGGHGKPGRNRASRGSGGAQRPSPAAKGFARSRAFSEAAGSSKPSMRMARQGASRAEVKSSPLSQKSFTELSNAVDTAKTAIKRAEQAVERASFRSRFPTREAYEQANAAAAAQHEAARQQLREARSELNAYWAAQPKKDWEYPL